MIMQLVRAGTFSALCFAASVWDAPKARAQWGGPTCQSVAGAELAQVGQQLGRVFAQALQNMDQNTAIAIELLGLGFAGQFDLSKPITVTPRVVGATAIARESLQTRCRVRATIAVTYSRQRGQVDLSGPQPTIRNQAMLEQFETTLVYDMIFVENEILESDVLQEIIKLTVEHATGRMQTEAHLHAEVEEVRQQQRLAERRQEEAQSRQRQEERRIAEAREQSRANRQTQIDRLRRQIASVERDIQDMVREAEDDRRRDTARGLQRDELSRRAARDERLLSAGLASRRQSLQQLRDQLRELEAQPGDLAANSPAIRPQITRQELNVIQAWFERCWNIADDPQRSRGSLRVHIRFNADGSLASRPEVRNAQPDPTSQQRANAVTRALLRCSAENPVRLPQDRHAAWSEAVIALD
ncbi:MAG: hypothetical protein JNK84_10765 [Phreatobacter sp.]|uniref:hypothetical protein n=1 Tax=Phreatobacter sp. TaxID=1966341 RepID=UPI001A44FE63|nr:hypothetical protein [Phreatobacter sp.]MBL8569555.1 hypothetical protein [Phreatobacter sp.]